MVHQPLDVFLLGSSGKSHDPLYILQQVYSEGLVFRAESYSAHKHIAAMSRHDKKLKWTLQELGKRHWRT